MNSKLKYSLVALATLSSMAFSYNDIYNVYWDNDKDSAAYTKQGSSTVYLFSHTFKGGHNYENGIFT